MNYFLYFNLFFYNFIVSSLFINILDYSLSLFHYLIDYFFFTYSFKPSWFVKEAYDNDFGFFSIYDYKAFILKYRRKILKIYKTKFHKFRFLSSVIYKVFFFSYYYGRPDWFIINKQPFTSPLIMQILSYNHSISNFELAFDYDSNFWLNFFIFNLFLWVMLLFFSINSFKGFSSLIFAENHFINADSAWLQFRKDPKEQTLLLFSKVYSNDKTHLLVDFESSLNIFFSAYSSYSPKKLLLKLYSNKYLNYWDFINYNLNKMFSSGVSFVHSDKDSLFFNFSFRYDIYIDQILKNKSVNDVFNFINIYENISDFTLFQTILKTIKYQLGFMTRDDFYYYKLLYTNWSDYSIFQTTYNTIFFMEPARSLKYEFVTQNNFYYEMHDNLNNWFTLAGLQRPVEPITNSLILAADSFGFYTYLSSVQIYDPRDFFYSVNFFEHILTGRDWLTSEFLEGKTEITILEELTYTDLFQLGFISYSDNLFYYDLVDFLIIPNWLIDTSIQATFLLYVWKDFSEQYLPIENEQEDESGDYPWYLNSEWFFFSKYNDSFIKHLINYLNFVDNLIFNFKLSNLFFHKDGTWQGLSNLSTINKKNNEILDKTLINIECSSYFGDFFINLGFWFFAWPSILLLVLIELYLPYLEESFMLETELFFAFLSNYFPFIFWGNFYLYFIDDITWDTTYYDEDFYVFLELNYDHNDRFNIMDRLILLYDKGAGNLFENLIGILLNSNESFICLISRFVITTDINLTGFFLFLFLIALVFFLKKIFKIFLGDLIRHCYLFFENYFHLTNSYNINIINYFKFNTTLKKNIILWY